MIWTTTPWTLPANEAVAVNAEFRYVARGRSSAPARREVLVLAAELLDACLQRYGADAAASCWASFTGSALEGPEAGAPVAAAQVPVILGEHVTLEAGTGAVHTAPAHGQEDYVVGLRYRLPVVNPVGPDGRFLARYAAGCRPARLRRPKR